MRPFRLALALFLFMPALASSAQDIPADYGIDLQLAANDRGRLMGGGSELQGTTFNAVGDEVFRKLIAGLSMPYPWKLTLVNNSTMNAGSTPGGQIYVYGGMLPLIKQNQGLWAAVLSHEVAHTALRHGVRVYLQTLYINRMIQYYRWRAANGDNSANYSLIGFRIASGIALKKLERDQEHEADQQGMLLMARAGYHPDYVFALHHLVLTQTGEQSKFAAFFSDHPRWETRDQRSDKVYADALAEFNRWWPDASSSPGGAPPLVAFVGQPVSTENKQDKTADVKIPAYCRNAATPLKAVLTFSKDGHPVRALAAQYSNLKGELQFSQEFVCLDRDDASSIVIHVPAGVVADRDRKLKAQVYLQNAQQQFVGGPKSLDVHIPKGALLHAQAGAADQAPIRVSSEDVSQPAAHLPLPVRSSLKGSSASLGPNPIVGRMGRYVNCVGDGLPVFESPVAGARRTALLKCGESVTTFDSENHWLRIRTAEGTQGYVSDLFISTGAESR